MSDFHVLSPEESRELEMVKQFQEKFETPVRDNPGLISEEMLDARIRHLDEEVQEYLEAWEQRDIEGCLDALVDLIYVALGTVNVHGFSPIWMQAFSEVHRANMAKEKVKSAEESKRGSRFDVVKPEGWKPPDLQSILREHDSDAGS